MNRNAMATACMDWHHPDVVSAMGSATYGTLHL